VDRRRLLIITQSLQAIQAAVLSVLVLTRTVQVWEIGVLSVFVGIVGAFDTPGRQAFVVQMVDDREHLANAIALNSTQFNLASLLGPFIAGITIRLAGEGICFVINAVSFLAVIYSLVLIRVEARKVDPNPSRPWADMVEGARYVRTNIPILSLLLLLAVISFGRGVYQVMLPVFAKAVYRGDSATLGFLFSSVAVGALLSAFVLASRKTVVGLGGWVVASGLVFSLSLGCFGLTKVFAYGLLILPFLGFGAMMQMGSSNTMIQSLVDDRMRGRVMSFYAMSFIGMMPMGSLAAGFLSNAFGPTLTLLLAGSSGLIGSLLFFLKLPSLRRLIRPIYVAKGIIPADQ
jgi:MFS family permease